MSQQSLIKRFYGELSGIDLRSKDISRKDRYARGSTNLEPLPNGSIAVRPGFRAEAPALYGVGGTTYIHRDPNGKPVEQVLGMGASLNKLVTGTFTISYSGSDDHTIAILPSEDAAVYSMVCEVVDNGVTVLSMDLGTGLDEASPVTAEDLLVAIHLLPNFAASYDVATVQGPAAMLGQILPTSVGAGLTVEFYYWEEIYSPLAAPFTDSVDACLAGDLDLASFLNTNEILLIATGLGSLYKYDYVSCYRAGMPVPADISGVAGGTGLTGYYQWFVTYEQRDARGNIVESDPSNILEDTLANETFTLTIPYLQDTTGFLTSVAIAANGGTDAGPTYTVDDGAGGAHSIQPGQTVYFLDNTGVDREEEVLSVTASSITLGASATYTVTNNTVFSANLRVNLYRNKAGDDKYYLVERFANDSGTANFTFADDIPDVDLTEEYQEPLGDGHTEPPSGIRFLTSFQGLAVGADTSDLVRHSDIDGPEYWTGEFLLLSKSNRPVRGVSANKEVLLVFKQDEVHAVIGSLAGGTARIELLSGGYGCDSHHSIVDIQDSFWFYSRTFGISRILGTNSPDEVSYRIIPMFQRDLIDGTKAINHSRVVAAKVPGTNLAMWFCPMTSEINGAEIPDRESLTLVADYSNQFNSDVEYDEQGRAVASVPKVRWWTHDAINMMGGAFEYEGILWWLGRTNNSHTATAEAPLYRRAGQTSIWDFHDHCSPIVWDYEHGWVDLGVPEVDKKFIKSVIFSLPEAALAESNISATAELNYINGTSRSRKEIVLGRGAGSGAWGVEPWGGFDWGSRVIPSVIFPFVPAKAKALKIRFSGTAWKNRPVISGWGIEAVPVYPQRIKVNG